jgi:trehalose 6-phosphate synthase
MLKEERPELVVAQFWHIPWPNPEAFRSCPWGEEILCGLLGNDLLGFHIQYYCNNFLSTVEISLEAVEDYEHFSVLRQGHQTFVRPFPISVDCKAMSQQAQSPEVLADTERLRHTWGLKGQLVGIGVDRVDYTKGIPERFTAIDRFLERYPQYHKRFTFLQVGPISRIHIPEYQALNDELYHLMVDINRKYGADGWVPIRILKASYSRKELLSFYRLADVCIVSSLHDGMNLVAKEFVSTCRDDSVLILSAFTGAARELSEAILINPFYVEGFADAIKMALEMPSEEREGRMRKMRQIVFENDVFNWATKVFTEMSRLSSG